MKMVDRTEEDQSQQTGGMLGEEWDPQKGSEAEVGAGKRVS